MDDIPTRDQIAEWLTSAGHPDAWAGSLTGLPWRYIRPVVTIAANTGTHPIAALTVAASYSTDPAFREAAAKHTRHHATPAPTPGPNRAQRRAAAKQHRRPR